MSPTFVIASDNHRIRRHCSFENAIHFCLDFMINSACNVPETLAVVRYSTLPEQCQKDKSEVCLVNSMVFFKKDDEQKFCAVVETSEEVDLEKLWDMVMCVITFSR